MYRQFVLGLIAALCFGGHVTASEGDFVKFQQILDSKCSQCHTRVRIDEAIARGADMDQIIAKMIRLGARLSDQERQVMGVFWAGANEFKTVQTPEPVTVAADPLREYRAVIQNRCTSCHSLDIVEKAMIEGRSIDDLVEMMRKRGAIITDTDKSVLGTFWGNPLREKPE